MGAEIAPEAWGGNISSIDEIKRLTKIVSTDPLNGMMVWSIQKKVNGQPSCQNPDFKMIYQSISQTLALGNCE